MTVLSGNSRRRFLQGLTAATAGCLAPAFFTTPGLFAEQLAVTPPQTEGPFYPDRLPLDTDNDLIIINNNITPAVGVISYLSGRVMDRNGNPVRNALVEIWQCDGNAVYLHTADSGTAQGQRQRDANFQGYGRFTTASTGEYLFRTIRPVPYPGRPAPHIHYKVSRGGRELLTTQCFVTGHAGNSRDGLYRAIRNPLDRELLLVDFVPMSGSQTGEQTATFDIVLGLTPDENTLQANIPAGR
jgi:protocatechuate 3,4-dioxygenase beta subunit